MKTLRRLALVVATVGLVSPVSSSLAGAPVLTERPAVVASPGYAGPQQRIPEWANAIGRVRMSNNFGGSCTLFTIEDGKGYVVTNAHVVGNARRATITFPNGAQHDGIVTWRVPGADAAFIRISAPAGIQPIPLAHHDDMPKAGEEIYMAGYGGSGSPKLTLWRATSRGFAAARSTDIAATTEIISGDSGGAQIYRGKLIGVNWGWTGHEKRAEAVSAPYIIHQMKIFKGGTKTPFRPWRNCPPGGGRRPPPGTIDVPVDNAPDNTSQWDKFRDEILAAIDQKIDELPPPAPGERGERGERGRQGERGERGLPGKDGQDAQVDVDKLAKSILENLPPVVLQLSDGDDTTPDEYVSGKLGEPLVIPPQRLRIRDGNQTFELAEALGQAIKIKVEGSLTASEN